MVTGASKRGWTTYLTGASDPRVKAIAPMVFDNLGSRRRCRASSRSGAGTASRSRTTRAAASSSSSPRARGPELVRMVDPWFYRERLKMPKLLIHGANDRYWATDATSLYWNDLLGEKSLLVRAELRPRSGGPDPAGGHAGGLLPSRRRQDGIPPTLRSRMPAPALKGR